VGGQGLSPLPRLRARCLPSCERACLHVRRCKTQRKNKRAGALDEARVASLNQLNFVWLVNKAVPFEDYFSILEEYKQKNDGTDPPTNLPSESRFGRRYNIAAWCDKMRRLHKKKQLEQAVVDKLNALNFHWRPPRGPSAAWEDNFSALKRFKQDNGRDNDPPRKFSVTKPDGRKLNLGKWCDTQRQAKKRKILGADQIRRLEAIGFTWNCNVIVDWHVYFDAVKQHKEAHVRGFFC
jgi:hypothetical protein